MAPGNKKRRKIGRRGERGSIVQRKGDYKREGKRERRERESVKSHGRKKGGYKGVIPRARQ